MTDNLKELEAKVRAAGTPEASATALVNGLADQLDALTHDPVAIKQLGTDLRAAASELGKACCEGAPEETKGEVKSRQPQPPHSSRR